MDRLHLVYDGDCAFCTRSLRVLQAFDTRHALQLHDARSRSRVLAQFPILADADLDEAMFAVQGERSWRGFFAFRQAIWQSRWTWPLLPLFYAPGATWLGPRIYALVARNRRSLGCGDTCAVPPPPGTGPGVSR